MHPGSRIVLALEVELKPGMHVYAPGVEGGYIPIEWRMAESKGWLAHPAEYPQSKMLHMAAIGETVPVYEGHFRITRDLTIGQAQELKPLLDAEGRLAVGGSFRYQACDEKECFPPQSVPLKWTFSVEQLDMQRARAPRKP